MTSKLQAQPGRIILLGSSSMLLCMSFVMSVFAPFPLALASILYGRRIGYLLGVACLVISLIVSVFIFKQSTMFFFFGGVFFLSILISEIVLRGISPMKGLIRYGIVFFTLLTLGIYGVFKTQEINVKEFIVENIKQSAQELKKNNSLAELDDSQWQEGFKNMAYLSQPELVAKEVMRVFPGYFFISVFFILWANLYLVLKSRRMLFLGEKFRYTEKTLLNYKVPENAVWFLIFALVLALVGEDFLQSALLSDVGYTLVKCLGLFYFFQGFGLYIKFLNFINVGGLLRTFLVMFTVFIAPWLLALMGVFDLWINFNKYFQKKDL